jgi:ornithine lipid ester-linked acyl 2-hydroxylase
MLGFIILFLCLMYLEFIIGEISLYSIYKNLGIVVILFLIFYFILNPTEALIPYNLFIENIYEKKVFYDDKEKAEIFPTSKILEKEWRNIKQECINTLSSEQSFGNVGKHFILESEEFWKGWKTFSLRMFSKDNEENMKKCPILSQILKSDSNITTAFFSIMEPGKILPSHYGPFKGILRYHLSLQIPPKEAGDCFISVDNEIYEWKEGEGVLFDETYKHFVKNETPYTRVILFLDVKRPFNNYFLSSLNDFILYMMSVSPYNS